VLFIFVFFFFLASLGFELGASWGFMLARQALLPPDPLNL
jgi:hypothetical protein